MDHGEPGMRDYVAWHDAYRDPNSALSVRLRYVQQAIERWYDETAGAVTILSSCAGQGDDILGVLGRRPDLLKRTRGTLIELHPTNVRIARERVDALGADLRVLEADASLTDTYRDAVPADLVLLSGIMGNISTEDIRRLVFASPQFCTPGATVIWTRGAQEPDLGPAIRGWFAEAGFSETAYDELLEGTLMRVGVERLTTAPVPLQDGLHLFTFYR